MISLEEFHTDFLQTVLSDTESRGLLKPQAFFENVCEELISSGDLTNNYAPAEYVKKGLEIHGYDYDEERRVLSLIVHQFFQEEDIQTLTKNNIDTKFSRLKNFFNQSIKGLYRYMEETSPEFSMAYNIFQFHNQKLIDRVRLITLTDGKLTRNQTEFPPEIANEIIFEYRVIDIEYIYKTFLSENLNNNFEMDFDCPLPCLSVDSDNENYQSYLSVISGDVLVNIYEKFGQKLFEHNVRTFLQFKSPVNKGLRNTIEYDPVMFFAYNNGITATATNVELNLNNSIKKITNFQIVNGGQTTSAIYAAKKTSKLDVSKVSVQMKLSVVKELDKQSDFVSKVSEYANTQNKVNKSDFFSNSPFHKEMKAYSKRVWVPAVNGLQRRTHWFYERARGEYLNEQLYLTPYLKKQFQLENPKNQFIDKKILAKSEVSWLQKPFIATKGAEYSFAEFANTITEKLEKDSLSISEIYFKEAVSRIILFREVEKLISSSDWYDGGYRSQTVAYSISYLSFLISQKNRFLNFNSIWEKQSLPIILVDILKIISKSIYEDITNPTEGAGSANIAQWCKKVSCWEKVKQLNLSILFDESILLNNEQHKYFKKEDKKNKKLEQGIDIQSFVVKLKKDKWLLIFNYFEKYKQSSLISPMQFDILKKMSTGKLMPPSEKQAKILYELYITAQNEGVTNI